MRGFLTDGCAYKRSFFFSHRLGIHRLNLKQVGFFLTDGAHTRSVLTDENGPSDRCPLFNLSCVRGPTVLTSAG